jgi:hypothetical protein
LAFREHQTTPKSLPAGMKMNEHGEDHVKTENVNSLAAQI